MKNPLPILRDLILDLLFPPFCVVCHRNGTWLCADCLAKRKQETSWRCLVCEKESSPHAICVTCQKAQPLQGIFITGHFDETMQTAVHAFKYKHSSVLAGPLARILADYLQNDQLFKTLDPGSIVLIPVPLHSSKLRSRGYNQSELLARSLAQLVPGLTVSKALQRTRATDSQMELDRQNRLTNVSEAFKLTPDVELTGKTVILIDDVSTTGATLFECAKALKPAGPKDIWAAVLGHG